MRLVLAIQVCVVDVTPVIYVGLHTTSLSGRKNRLASVSVTHGEHLCWATFTDSKYLVHELYRASLKIIISCNNVIVNV